MPRRFLLLSAPFGTGHMQAARAVEAAIRTLDPSAEVRVEDAFSLANPVVGRALTSAYLEMLRFAPWLYGSLYRISASGRCSASSRAAFIRLLDLALSPGLFASAAGCGPDGVICTHPFPLGVASAMKRRGQLACPLVGVVTDFDVHPLWAYGNVDFYTVATETVKQQLVARGISGARVAVTGIPVRPALSGSHSQVEIRRELGLAPDTPTVLVMGGGLGLGPIEHVVRGLSRSSIRLQLVVVTGHNRKLYLRLVARWENSSRAIILGHTDRVGDLLDVADLLVTKPGAITVSEALAKGVPLILCGGVQGHEELNRRFLVGTGAAIWISPEAIGEAVVGLLSHPRKLGAMKAKALGLGRPGAALEAARAILRAASNMAGSNDLALLHLTTEAS